MLTTTEATNLLNELKTILTNTIIAPKKSSSESYDVVGNTTNTPFSISIYRGKININKYNFSARVKKGNIVILELHVNAGNRHENPDGTIIIGSHWHYYTEDYGMRTAFPALDITSPDFVSSTLIFFEKFNIINKVSISEQLEI